MTTDNGRTWKRIKVNIEKVLWGILPDPGVVHTDTDDTAQTIYATVGGMQVTDPILQHCKYKNMTVVIYNNIKLYAPKTLSEKVSSFLWKDDGSTQS